MIELDVALALINRQGKTLLGKRASSAHLGAKYEFIGGKVMQGESPSAALKRECSEELGVRVHQLKSACTLSYRYPDRAVRLHVFWAELKDKNPRPLGTESLHWVDFSRLNQMPMPAANSAIKQVAQLPKIYCITPDLIKANRGQGANAGFTSNQAASNPHLTNQWLQDRLGLPINSLVYVRLKSLDLNSYVLLVKKLAQARSDLKLVCEYRAWHKLNSHVFAAQLSCDELMSVKALPMADHLSTLWFASVHSEEQIARANQLGVHAITLSAINPTPTHPEAAALGWQQAQELAELCQCTVYALGGLCPEDLDQCLTGNFYGVAGIRHFS